MKPSATRKRVTTILLALLMPTMAACAGAPFISAQAGVSLELPPGPPSRDEAGSYRYDLRIDPPRPRASEPLAFTVTITPADGRPFPAPGESRVRFFLVSGDLEEFHGVETPSVLPSDGGGGTYSFGLTLATGGHHGLVIGFLDQGRPVTHCIRIPVEGPPQGQTRWDFSRERLDGGVRGVLRSTSSRLEPREPLDFSIQLSENGLPVAGLEPIGGGVADILVMRRGPESPALISGSDTPGPLVAGVGGGSRVHFSHRFPTNDKYRVFVRYRRGGMTRTLVYDLWLDEAVEPRLPRFLGED